MSLFSSLLNVGIARRVGIWAVLQALPDEDDLKLYLRAAYKGFAVVIIGAVLTGAAIAAGIAAAYNFLLEGGWERSEALAATGGFTVLLIIACFALATHWLSQLASVKEDLSPKQDQHSIGAIVNDAVNDVTKGFLEGLTTKSRPAPQRPTTRRIRLIN